jgi:hypothetical protein
MSNIENKEHQYKKALDAILKRSFPNIVNIVNIDVISKKINYHNYEYYEYDVIVTIKGDDWKRYLSFDIPPNLVQIQDEYELIYNTIYLTAKLIQIHPNNVFLSFKPEGDN